MHRAGDAKRFGADTGFLLMGKVLNNPKRYLKRSDLAKPDQAKAVARSVASLSHDEKLERAARIREAFNAGAFINLKAKPRG